MYSVTIELSNGRLQPLRVPGTRYTAERGILRVYDDAGGVVEFAPGRWICIERVKETTNAD